MFIISNVELEYLLKIFSSYFIKEIRLTKHIFGNLLSDIDNICINQLTVCLYIVTPMWDLPVVVWVQFEIHI